MGGGKWKRMIPAAERAKFLRQYKSLSREARKEARKKYINKRKRVGKERKGPRELRKQRADSGCEQCVYVPHPDRLLESICGVCACPRPSTPSVALYNKTRRQYKAALGLSSLIAPLAWESQSKLKELIKEFGLKSNTTTMHVTLIEGLRVARIDAEQWRARSRSFSAIGEALREKDSSCRLEVTGLEIVPTRRDQEQSLVVLQLGYEGPEIAAAAKDAARRWAILPQWPLHCALGVTDRERALAIVCAKPSSAESLLNRVKKLALRLDADAIRELSPPALEESGSQARMLRSLPEAVCPPGWLAGRDLGLPGDALKTEDIERDSTYIANRFVDSDTRAESVAIS